MKRRLTWDDAEEIALALIGKYPEVNPLSVRFTDLRRWVLELEQFEDEPGRSSEGLLEAIQMAWVEEK